MSVMTEYRFYGVQVDSKGSLQTLAQESGITIGDPKVTEKNFPLDGTVGYTADFELLEVEAGVSFENGENRLRDKKLDPASLHGVMDLAWKETRVRRCELPIVISGSRYLAPGCMLYVPVLHYGELTARWWLLPLQEPVLFAGMRF